MSISFRVVAAAVGMAALLGAVGVDVAEAGTYPKAGTYHEGGEGATVEPSPEATTLSTASFAPQIHGQIGCGAVAWGGGCG